MRDDTAAQKENHFGLNQADNVATRDVDGQTQLFVETVIPPVGATWCSSGIVCRSEGLSLVNSKGACRRPMTNDK
jgi:hypothetical protein